MNAYQKIQEVLKDRGMIVMELSQETGVGYSTISNGKYFQYSNRTLKELTEALDLDFEELKELNKELPTLKQYLAQK